MKLEIKVANEKMFKSLDGIREAWLTFTYKGITGQNGDKSSMGMVGP